MAKKETPKVVNEDSAALDTVRPGSKPADLPRTKFETIRAVIGKLAEISDEDLNHFNATQAQVGPGKLSSTLPSGATAEHNKSTIEMHPSAAVSKHVKEDVETLLAGGEGLTEEFKTKAATLFEAALNTQVAIKEAELQDAFTVQVDEKVKEIIETLSEEVNVYLAYVASEWVKENQVAIDQSLKVEIYEDFISGMKKVFEETYITIPDEQVSVVETLAMKVDELETSLNGAIRENANLRFKLDEATHEKVIATVCEGLTMNESEKLKELASNLDYDNLDDFSTKLKVIKESNFVKKDSKVSLINEQLEETSDDNKTDVKEAVPAEMQSFYDAISRTTRK